MKPNLNAGSSLASALAHSTSANAHIRNSGNEQMRLGLKDAFDSLQKTYSLRAHEAQLEKENDYKNRYFDHSREVFEHQKAQDKQNNARLDKEFALRQKESAMTQSLNAQKLQSARMQNAFLKGMYEVANSRYTPQPQEIQTQALNPLLQSPHHPQPIAPTSQVSAQSPQTQLQAQIPQNASQSQAPQIPPHLSQSTQPTPSIPQAQTPPDKSAYMKFVGALRQKGQAKSQELNPELVLQSRNAKDSNSSTAQTQPQEVGTTPQIPPHLSQSTQPTPSTPQAQPTQTTATPHPLQYFQDKINAGESLNEVDYLTLQGLGLNPRGLGSNADLNADLKVKKADITKGLTKTNSALTSLQSNFALMNDTQGNSGLVNGVIRRAHKATGGLVPLNDELARYHARDMGNTKAIAQALAGGKATNQDKQDASAIYSTSLKDQETQLHTLSGAVEESLFALNEGIRMTQEAGGQVSPITLQARNEAQEIFDYLKTAQDKKRKFNYKKFKEMTNAFNKTLNRLSE